MQKLLTAPSLALIALLIVLPSCGDTKNDEAEKSLQVISEARNRFEAAGQNVKKLVELRGWVDQRLRDDGADVVALESFQRKVDNAIVSAFQTIARKMQRLDASRVDTFSKWADGLKETLPADLIEKLGPGYRSLAKAALKVHPDDTELRRKVGWKPVEIDLDAWRKAPYLDTDADVRLVDALETNLAKDAWKAPDGTLWIPPSWKHAGDISSLMELVAKRRKEWEERQKDPFFQEAQRIADTTRADLAKALNESYKWMSRIFKPYLFLVEKDKAWDEAQVARQKSEMVLQLYDLFYTEYREPLGLTDITDPVPVVVFRKHEAYQQYAAKRGADSGAVGHFEHDTGRLLVSDETDRDTLFHEGTHQVIAYNTKGRLQVAFLNRSYWFQEGVAEYFGATSVSLDPETKKWVYTMGLLQEGRLSWWRQNERNAYPLWDLLALTYGDREKNKTSGNEDFNLYAYSQGWFLVYFLNNFLVDSEGVVQIGKPGKYRKGWLKYFRGELDGKTGRDFFLQCMGLMGPDGQRDEAKWKTFEKEFYDYYEWINRKISLKYHVKNRRLIPWNEVVNRKGRKIGEKEDDMLHPPAH